jgi:ERO1-like protein beta
MLLWYLSILFTPLVYPFISQDSSDLTHQPSRDKFCKSTPTGPIEITSCDYESIDSVNDQLYANLKDLVHTPFFRYFQVDLYRECPFWRENGLCMDRECGITTVDEVWLSNTGWCEAFADRCFVE